MCTDILQLKKIACKKFYENVTGKKYIITQTVYRLRQFFVAGLPQITINQILMNLKNQVFALNF